MYEGSNGQSAPAAIPNGYQTTNTSATFYSAVQYNSPATATAAVIQPQPSIPIYYQQQAYQIQYQQPQLQVQPQFYVQQQQQMWTTTGVAPAQQQQPFYQPQYQYATTATFQQQTYPQTQTTPAAPLVNLTRLVNQSNQQTTAPLVIATPPAIMATSARVPSPSRPAPGVSPASSTGTSHMYPVRLKGMIKGARTKAKMRELIQEEAKAEAKAEAAKKAKRNSAKKADNQKSPQKKATEQTQATPTPLSPAKKRRISSGNPKKSKETPTPVSSPKKQKASPEKIESKATPSATKKTELSKKKSDPNHPKSKPEDEEKSIAPKKKLEPRKKSTELKSKTEVVEKLANPINKVEPKKKSAEEARNKIEPKVKSEPKNKIIESKKKISVSPLRKHKSQLLQSSQINTKKGPTIRVKASDLKKLNKLKLKTQQDKKFLTVGRQVLRVEAEKVRFYRGGEEEDVEEISKKAALHERPHVEFDDSVEYRCVFCNFRPYFLSLGDLFGPYYTDVPVVNGQPVKNETWLHAGCSIWAPGVVLIGSTLLGLTEAVEESQLTICKICYKKGATIPCLEKGCKQVVHLPCALMNQWTLENDTFLSYCREHISSATPGAELFT